MKRITISIASQLLVSTAVLFTLVAYTPLSILSAGATLPTTVADFKTKPQSPIYNGSLDLADCNTIAGWAADRNRPNTPITVSIFADSTLVTTLLANVSRPDVAAALGDNGLHGFSIPFPRTVQDIHSHSISVRFESTNIELGSSPKTVQPCVTPPEGTGQQVRLELTLNIGADKTTIRLIGLHFTAVERAAGARNPVAANITEYRVREVGLNEPLTSISASPWQPIGGPLILELGEHNDFGQRYGERRVLLQVKAADGLISNVASDTITLEPHLKEYTIHANADHTHPLIQYAASQGFTFPRTFFQVCTGGHGGNSPSDISSGFAQIDGGALACPASNPDPHSIVCRTSPACETRFEYELFGGERQLNKFWHIKSVAVSGGDVKFHGVNSYLLKGHVSPHNDCGDCPSGTFCDGGVCVPINLDPSAPTVTIGDIVIEGPDADDFVDTSNPWKNAFVKPLTIHPINTRRPN